MSLLIISPFFKNLWQTVPLKWVKVSVVLFDWKKTHSDDFPNRRNNPPVHSSSEESKKNLPSAIPWESHHRNCENHFNSIFLKNLAQQTTKSFKQKMSKLSMEHATIANNYDILAAVHRKYVNGDKYKSVRLGGFLGKFCSSNSRFFGTGKD